MEKIRRVSLFFRVIFQIIFIALPIVLAISWIIAPSPLQSPYGIIQLSSVTQAYPVLHTLSPLTKFYGFLAGMIPTGILMITAFFLIRLFRLFESGKIFTIKNVATIKNIGITLLIGQLLHPVFDALNSLIITWGNPHGHRLIAVSVTGTNIGVLLMAIFVILISWIMAEGYKLNQEQELTI